MNSVASFLYNLARERPKHWRPVLSVYYLTYACSFRCPYCSDGARRPYWTLDHKVLPGDRVLDLLARIRRHTEYLVITGGEPVLHPDFGPVMAGLGALGFRNTILTTNGFEIEPVLARAAPAIQTLVVSLDTLEAGKADRWFGIGAGTLARVLTNIERAAATPGRRFEMVISSVVTPDNIEDLFEVYRYARERRFRFAACPQLVGVRANSALPGDPRYHAFFDFLIGEKRRGADVHGTVDYLMRMRDLEQFRCRPFTMLVVGPGGEVFYPCLEIGHHAGNLLEQPDLDAIKQAGEERFGPVPDCPSQCHSACALGFARAMANPLSILDEGYRWVKGRMKRGW